MLSVLTIWTAAQNIGRIATMVEDRAMQSGSQDQRQLIDAVQACAGPVVAESPLIPILADQRRRSSSILSPSTSSQSIAPTLATDLVERIKRREFACVVLEQDPATAKGQAWYTNVNLTRPVMDAVVEQYKLDQTIAGERFFRAVQ